MPKKNKKQQTTSLSQWRQDIVTGDWVIIATGRGKRPHEFIVEKKEVLEDALKTCPFEDPEKTGQEQDVLIYRRGDGEWTLRVFPNKYPAVSPSDKIKLLDQDGPYFGMEGIGYHELVVPRDHEKHFALMEVMDIAEVVDAYQERYLDLMSKKSINYISIIHNHGKEAGASLIHPHSQIFAIPVVAPYIQLELSGADRYFQANRSCPYCVSIRYDREQGDRIIYENDDFVAFCPYASRVAFEVWIAPKEHSPYFERIANEQKLSLAEALQKTFSALFWQLKNPDYNMYLHSAPCDGQEYPNFHWHIEILPQTAEWGGFELSTGVEVSTILPESSAQFLREIN